MISKILPIFIYLLPTLTYAQTAEDAFKAEKVKVLKVETHNDIKTYFVELPFDPSVGSNSSRLKARVAVNNGCKSFAFVSAIDKVKVNVIAKKIKGECELSENIENLK